MPTTATDKNLLPNSPAPKVRGRRWLRITAAALAALIVLLVLASAWTVSTTTGLHTALSLATRFAPGSLTLEGVSGTIRSPMTIAKLRYENATLRIVATDIVIDWQKNAAGRVYLPQDELQRFGLSDADIAHKNCNEAWQKMLRFQCQRARNMLESGKPLGKILPGRMGAELRVIIAGGATILDKIDAVNGDVFLYRPKMNKWDWLRVAPRALLPF